MNPPAPVTSARRIPAPFRLPFPAGVSRTVAPIAHALRGACSGVYIGTSGAEVESGTSVLGQLEKPAGPGCALEVGGGGLLDEFPGVVDRCEADQPQWLERVEHERW